MAQIIDGKAISQAIKDEVKREVEGLSGQGITVTLAVVQVGSNPASTVYVNNKKKACAYTGIRSLSYNLPENASQEELLSLIAELNGRADVNGILVQLPLPSHMRTPSSAPFLLKRMWMVFIRRTWELCVSESRDLFPVRRRVSLNY